MAAAEYLAKAHDFIASVFENFGWDNVIGVAEVIAIIFAANTAKTVSQHWRDQKVETRKAELAEEALNLIYQARSVFDEIRNPFSYAGEGETRPKQEDEDFATKRKKDLEFVPFERLIKNDDYFTSILKIQNRIKAVIGPPAAEHLAKIISTRAEFIRALHRLKHLDSRLIDLQDSEKRQEIYDEIKRLNDVKWGGYEDGDQINQRLSELIVDAERELGPLLNRQYQG